MKFRKVSRDKIGMISPAMKQAEYPIRILYLLLMPLKRRKMFEMNSKNKRFFDSRLIGYPITAIFERISSNVIASEKKKVKKDLLSVRIQNKRIKR